MSRRKHRLVDCNPKWVGVTGVEDVECAVWFDCPEGHEDCVHVIPFTPTLVRNGRNYDVKSTGTVWQRTGDTFENLTLSPSVRRKQRYANCEDAIAAGCLPAYVTESLWCALHIFIVNGEIQFCEDSK